MRYWKDLFQRHILQRGEVYYYEGAVKEVNKNDSGCTAIVEGTESYEVTVRIAADAVIDMSCTCPYAADGNNCKHMAAVLFALDGAENTTSIDYSLPDETEQLIDVIASMTEEDAKALLLHIAVRDPDLRTSIILKHAKKIGKSHVKDIKFRIDRLEGDFCDMDGFISYHNAWDYGCALRTILDTDVQMLIDRNLILPAFEIVNHVFYTVASQDMDDSDGTISFVADACYESWKQILARADKPDTAQMFQWFKTHRTGYVPDYLEDHIDKILMNEFHDESMLQEKLEFLDKEIMELQKYIEDDRWFYKRYQYSQKVMCRLAIMKEQELPFEAQLEYAKGFRDLSDVRKWEAASYLNDGSVELAINVLKESCELDKAYPGLVSGHIEQLLDIYLKNGRMNDYRTQLIDYIFKHRQDNLNYIYDLKDICTEDEWYSYREELLKANTIYHIRGILLESEEMYDQLLEMVKASRSLYEVDRYENTLKLQFPEELKLLYLEILYEEIARADNRKKYRWVISYLSKLKDYPGGYEDAQVAADEWKVLYKNRTALKDELKKAGF